MIQLQNDGRKDTKLLNEIRYLLWGILFLVAWPNPLFIALIKTIIVLKLGRIIVNNRIRIYEWWIRKFKQK